jgi:peptide/nickel transport system substrate-binding protein
MPATGPIPVEVAKCFEGKASSYGRYQVSTGPYMIEGADKLDASSCKTLKPISGFDGQTRLNLVRNPDYEPKTDSKAARESLPDRFEFTINPNVSDIVARIAAGELEDVNSASIPPQTLRRYLQSSDLRKYLHLNPGDLTDYLTMNLTQPPFDDVHVRRAMNWVMDKAAMVQAWGGPVMGKVAHHIAPDTLFGNQLAEYAPYKTPGDHGGLAKAKAAMKGSKYDTKHDGTCSAPVCKNVLMLTDTHLVDDKLTPVVRAAAAKIGITFTVRRVSGAYPVLQTTSKNIAIGQFPGWAKDYADPLTFFNPLFDGRTIIPTGNVNYSLVGLTPSRAKGLGLTGNLTGIPSVDAQIDRCTATTGQARLTCYENLDRTLMTKVVPWVPYLSQFQAHITGPTVTKWEYDQFSGGTAYAHVAVR